ncbi:MAG: NADH-quinone oxidoreductase subunit NuoK [bacterium]|jgi:NADH-quinone oxidoreductase subunit K
MIIGLDHYLAVSAILFGLGLTCILMRRDLLLILMGLEMNLNAANLALVAFSRYGRGADGQVLTLFVIAIAAAEAAVGLAIVVALFKNRRSVNADDFRSLKG